jgi:hypothetical protein
MARESITAFQFHICDAGAGMATVRLVQVAVPLSFTTTPSTLPPAKSWCALHH